MKIVKLTSENVKRIRLVEIEPSGNMIVVGGKNGNGKTSLLDSIVMALAGKAAIPSKPVRDGEKQADIEIEMDEDFVIHRRIKPDGDSTVTVKNKAGAKYGSPQALLDGFAAKFTFDPLAFKSMKPAAQVALLKDVLGLDFTQADKERAELFSLRTDMNRQIRDLEGQIPGKAKHDGVPAEEVSAVEIVAKIDQATKAATEKQRLESYIVSCEQRDHQMSRTVAEKRGQIQRLTDEIAKIEAEQRQLIASVADTQEKIDAMDVPESAELQRELSEVEATNRKVRENRERAKLASRLKGFEDQANTITDSIERIDVEKKKALSDAHFPVDGLGFDNDCVVFNGIPFDQLSGAEQLRVSVGIGIALNPKLKVLLIRDGSLLDEDNLRLVAELAAEHDAQVWLERVGDGEEVAIVMEDGSVRAGKDKVTA